MTIAWVVFALLSGALTACAFPPVDQSWLGAVGLVPLTASIWRGRGPAWAQGFLAGLVFFLICGAPLSSASAWSGWAAHAPDSYAERMGSAAWILRALWVGFALWCSVFWAVWAVLARQLARRSAWAAVFGSAAVWVVLTEWARSQATFGCTWAFLGNALADAPSLRQAAAIGGVWWLSLAMALLNMAAAALVSVPRPAFRPAGVAAVASAIAIWLSGGGNPAPGPAAGRAIEAAVVHYHKPGPYTLADYLPTRLERGYLSLVRMAMQSPPALLVLPESSVFAVVRLDGPRLPDTPEEHDVDVRLWDQEAAGWLAGQPTMLIAGMETSAGGHRYNSLVAWHQGGRAGVYHKRRLVPFAEYQPRAWQALGLRGQSQYTAGRGSQLIDAGGGAVLGSFLCQEVVYPALLRESVRAGATVLVTGAQDGVFIDPVVAVIEADLAQLRAVETGRYIVRAVKDGVSAIISPTGQELARSEPGTGGVVRAAVQPLAGTTLYVQWGDWVVWLCAFGTAAALASSVRPAARRA